MHNLIILPTTVLLKGPTPGQLQVSADPAQGKSENGCTTCTKLRV